ncbi:MAG: hypothetical protein OXG15_08465 [Gammaproteobacteria bacterium]|nr:hypothetical protein [Gammaproteobacteria bacterium]
MLESIKTILKLTVLQTKNREEELYYVYRSAEISDDVVENLIKCGQILDRLYLNEIPFITVVSEADEIECAEIGWGIYMPYIEDLEAFLELDFDIVLFNLQAHDIVLSSDIEGTIFDINKLDVVNLHKEHNLHVYYTN